METNLSQKLYFHTRNLLARARTSLNFEEAVYGPLFLTSVVYLAHATSLRKLCANPESRSWMLLRRLLADRYPNIADCAEGLLSKLSRQDIQEFAGHVVDAYYQGPTSDAYVLSGLYAKLKGGWRGAGKTARDSVGRGEKIIGKELLLKTQFFTEPHMVHFLVRKALNVAAHGEQLDAASFPAIVDPAAGASNFLIGALFEGVNLLEGHVRSRQASVEVIAQRLFGYELDPLLAELGALNVDLAIARFSGALASQRPRVHAGRPGDELGFLNTTSCGEFLSVLPSGRRLILTNPPYLGRRMMSVGLKQFIKELWPESKGDLCTAFTLRCVDVMRPKDILGLVHQNALFHLSSLASARSRLLTQCAMVESVDLGSGAFEALSGEKANVSLSLFEHGAHSRVARLVDLSDLPYKEKISALNNEISKSRILAVSNQALNSGRPITQLRTRPLQNVLDLLPTYGAFASPMQGTSTGDNQRAIRYSWEVSADNHDWVAASKGGGFAKWWGLNRYVVWWGRAGERLREIEGSALRNIHKQTVTQLVFSDTGTAGLNVRRLKKGQVFIASGPGIHVKEGDPYAHLAFLNSRLATYCLRGLNPKLTVSAGYLKRLPFSEQVATNAKLAFAGRRCVQIKRDILATKLGSDDFDATAALPASPVDFDSYFKDALACELDMELEKIDLEARIESEVRSAFLLSASEIAAVNAEVGVGAGDIDKESMRIESKRLDETLARFFSVGLHYRNGIKLPGGIAADGPLEAAAFVLTRAPYDIVNAVHQNIGFMANVRKMYLEDLLHKLVLCNLGFNSDRTWIHTTMPIRRLHMLIQDYIPDIDSLLTSCSPELPKLSSWIEVILPRIHSDVFFGSPIIRVSDGGVSLARTQ